MPTTKVKVADLMRGDRVALSYKGTNELFGRPTTQEWVPLAGKVVNIDYAAKQLWLKLDDTSNEAVLEFKHCKRVLRLT